MALCKGKKCTSLSSHLSTYFYHHGSCIGRHPLMFTIIPVLIAILSSAAFFRLELTTDIEYQFFAINGRATNNKLVIESLFPENSTDCDISRLAAMGKFGMVIATAKHNESMLQNRIFDELYFLHQAVLNMNITWNGRNLSFIDICRKSNGKCIETDVLSLRKKIDDLKKGFSKIRYPIDIDSASSKIVFYPMTLGGVTRDEHDIVKDFRAVRLTYPIDHSNHTKYEIAMIWEKKFLELMNKLRFDNIKITKFSGRSVEDELNQFTTANLHLFFAAQILMFSFAAITCMTADCVTSKPWIGIAGCMSSVLGLGTAFSLMILCGKEYIDLNISIPIFVLGIGIDDSFVILASWRKTDAKDDIEKRMAETYSEAAVSITITTLTNVVATLIGITTPYHLIRIICSYMAISFAFAYIFQLTFFGGCLAISGYREKRNLHGLCCINVNKNQTPGIKRILTAGIFAEKGDKDIYLKFNFYRDVIGTMLSHKLSKYIVIFCFIIYFALGIYFMRFVSLDLDYSDLYPSTSYLGNYVRDDFRYFSEYRERIQVIINTPIDYSDPKIQEQLEDLTRKLENSPNMAGYNMTESWFRAYIQFIKSPASWFSLSGYNTSNPQDFVDALDNIFLRFKIAERFKKDIVFDSNKTKIIASRFFVQSQAVNTSIMQTNLLGQLHDIIDSSELSKYVLIYCYELVFADSFINVLPYVLRSLCVSSALVIIIFLLFIPDLLCAFCIVLSVISIVISTIGYSSVWGVNINTPVMVLLVLIAGFCVDYASHVSCAYVFSKSDIPNEKMKDALKVAGHAVIQGGGSTLLGISVMMFASYRIFFDFMKLIGLTVLFSVLYGIILLPVLLTYWDNIISLYIKKKKQFIENEEASNLPMIRHNS